MKNNPSDERFKKDDPSESLSGFSTLKWPIEDIRRSYADLITLACKDTALSKRQAKAYLHVYIILSALIDYAYISYKVMSPHTDIIKAYQEGFTTADKKEFSQAFSCGLTEDDLKNPNDFFIIFLHRPQHQFGAKRYFCSINVHVKRVLILDSFQIIQILRSSIN